MSVFTGSWKFDSAENFEPISKGFTVFSNTPHLTVTVSGSHYVFREHWSYREPITIQFDLGVEFDDVFYDGKVYTSIVKKVGDKLVQEATKGKRSCTVERWVDGNMLFTTCERNGFKVTFKYRRVG